MPSTSVQIWISSAPIPAPTMDAVKSDPPRPSVVVTPSAVEPMKPPITTTWVSASAGMVSDKPPIGLGELGRGLRVTPVGDDDAARIHVRGAHAEMAKGQGDDQARQPLAVTGDGVDRARRQLAEHGQPFHQFGQFLEMLVERAVEFGALGQRHHQARLARVRVAQIVDLAQVLFARAFERGLRDGQQLVRGLAHGGDHDHRLAVAPRLHDGRDAFDGGRRFHRRAAEFHDACI